MMWIDLDPGDKQEVTVSGVTDTGENWCYYLAESLAERSVSFWRTEAFTDPYTIGIYYNED